MAVRPIGAPRKPIRGIVYVARAIVVLSKRRPAGSDACLLHLNGGPGIVIAVAFNGL